MSENALGKANSGTEEEDKIFSCNACGSEHNTQTGLSIHETKTHGGPVDKDGNECPECGRSYSCQRGLVEHLSGQSDCTGQECDTCGRAFPTERGLSVHKKQVHNIDTRPKITCDECGKSKRVDPNYVEKRDEIKFCSLECLGEWRSRNKTGKNNPTYKERESKECEICGSDFSVLPHQSDQVCCSESCGREYVTENYSGEDSPHWKGGHARYYGENWYQQARKARKRDNYMCQSCGKDMSGDGRDPDVHHIKRLAFYQEKYDSPDWWERGNRLENLVSLCRPCHQKWEGIPVAPRLL